MYVYKENKNKHKPFLVIYFIVSCFFTKKIKSCLLNFTSCATLAGLVIFFIFCIQLKYHEWDSAFLRSQTYFVREQYAKQLKCEPKFLRAINDMFLVGFYSEFLIIRLLKPSSFQSRHYLVNAGYFTTEVNGSVQALKNKFTVESGLV